MEAPTEFRFAVVFFKKYGVSDAVPRNWIRGNNCFWPTHYPIAKQAKAARKEEVPDSTWESLEILIKCEAQSYAAARAKLVDYVDGGVATSDLNRPTAELSKKRKRKPVDRYSPEDNDADGDSSSSENLNEPALTKKTVVSPSLAPAATNLRTPFKNITQSNIRKEPPATTQPLTNSPRDDMNKKSEEGRRTQTNNSTSKENVPPCDLPTNRNSVEHQTSCSNPLLQATDLFSHLPESGNAGAGSSYNAQEGLQQVSYEHELHGHRNYYQPISEHNWNSNHLSRYPPNERPQSSTYQPSSSTYQPSSSTYQPSSSTYQPSSSTYQPSSSTYQPSSSTYQPSSSTYQPSSRTYQPSSRTYQPSSSTYQPPLNTELTSLNRRESHHEDQEQLYGLPNLRTGQAMSPEIAQAFEIVYKKLEIIMNQNSQLLDAVAILQQSAKPDSTCVTDALVVGKLPRLPMQSMEDFDAMEEHLLTDQVTQFMGNKLKLIGGRNTKHQTRRVMKCCMSNGLACYFNWAGKGGQKRGFKDTALQELATRTILTGSSTDDPSNIKKKKKNTSFVVEETIKQWLKSAPKRSNPGKRRSQLDTARQTQSTGSSSESDD